MNFESIQRRAEEEARPARSGIDLDNRYRAIGIAAVAAAVRFTGEGDRRGAEASPTSAWLAAAAR